MTEHSFVVAGCAGRMGRALAQEIIRSPGLALAGAFERRDSAAVGQDIGVLAGGEPIGIKVDAAPERALGLAQVLLDFTTPEASLLHARAAAAAGVALVLGTTGMSESDDREIEALARKIPIVRSGNFSLGVNLLAALAEEAARLLPDDYDIEVAEAHHRDKMDAPSGTALMLGRAAAAGRGLDFQARAVMSREGVNARRRAGDIGFAVTRGGGLVGEHSVLFAGSQEALTLSHRAIDRGLFARGAVVAAKWAVGRPPALYTMRDVLGFSARKS